MVKHDPMKRYDPVAEFDLFWDRYPRRVGKLAAMKAFAKARTISTADEIMVGVELYRQNLPDEERFIAHASSWLNAGRWMDEYDEPAPVARREPCDHTPTCNSPQWCDVLRARERGEVA